ncbi:MAG: cobalt ECF transporter T component CbiQ [Methanolobus sp.]|nr:cobalt ECF transporter T component CbiQ [Methanolobus sp.]
MSYPVIDTYSTLDSILHRFDPRAKLITFTILIFSFAFITELVVALLAVIFSIILIFISRIPLHFVYISLKFPALFIFMIIVVMAFTVQGSPLIGLGYVSITIEGLYIGALIFLRAIASLILAFLMLATSRFDEIIKAMYSLKIPNILIQMITFSYRYIFVLLGEFFTMKRSMYTRGFKMKLNQYSLNIIGNMIGMLLVKSYERGEKVYRSMLSRGYTGNPRLFTDFRMVMADYMLSSVLLLIAFSVQLFPFVISNL